MRQIWVKQAQQYGAGWAALKLYCIPQEFYIVTIRVNLNRQLVSKAIIILLIIY